MRDVDTRRPPTRKVSRIPGARYSSRPNPYPSVPATPATAVGPGQYSGCPQITASPASRGTTVYSLFRVRTLNVTPGSSRITACVTTYPDAIRP